MGKDLKGKELGVGIGQRKEDGLYSARLRIGGQNKIRYFKKLKDAKEWIAMARYNINSNQIMNSDDRITVTQWFEIWLNEIKTGKIAAKTRMDYRDLYKVHINPVIGTTRLCSLKVMDCTKVLTIMGGRGFSDATIKKVRTVMHSMFDSAEENGFIIKNPITKSVNIEGCSVTKKYIMTKEEQDLFLEEIKGHIHYVLFAFILQTGLRYGEIIGLKWEDIDFEKRTLSITRALTWDTNSKKYIEKSPKSKAGYRTIPLSNEAIRLLNIQKELLNNTLFVEDYKDYIFRNKNGRPSNKTTLNKSLKNIVTKMGIPIISLHCLRHMFATRCIEAGIRPKTLQKIMGHSKISVTMDLYVHVTDDELLNEFSKFSEYVDTTGENLAQDLAQ